LSSASVLIAYLALQLKLRGKEKREGRREKGREK